MIIRKTIGLLLFILATALLRGQSNDPTLNKRFIELTGTSEMEIVPDEIYITITLMERGESKEKVSIDKQENDLKQSIKDLGIDLSNLTLNTADLDFGRIRVFKKDVLTSKSYLLKVSSAETVGRVYEKLDKMNAHDAYISSFKHSKILDYQKENRIKALKAAKEKVDYLLAAVGQQAGLPLQINEYDNYVQEAPMQPRYMAKNAVMAYDANQAGEEISFKKIKIRSSIMVKYEIVSK